MFHQVSKALADICIRKEWIDKKDRDWCIYAIEKRIIMLPFWIFIFFWMVFTKLYIETVSFVIPVFALRRRMGGWHAPNFQLCFMMSTSIVALFVGVFGKILSNISSSVVIFLDLAIIFTSILIKPVYPPQVFISTAEIIANNKIKNLIIFLILIVQLIFILLKNFSPVIYSFLGITTVIISVEAEKLNKRGIKNEIT